MIPVVVGAVALFVGIGLGAGGDSANTKTVTRDIEHTTTVSVTETETPAPVITTQTMTKTLKPPPPTATVTKTIRITPTPKAALTGDGIFLVGREVQPGTYRSSGGSDCYWARLSGLSGDFDDIITNGIGAHQIVTISPSDAGFDTQDCGEWTRI